MRIQNIFTESTCPAPRSSRISSLSMLTQRADLVLTGLGFSRLGNRIAQRLGFRVLGFRVLGFRVLGFRVLGFRV